MRARIVKVEVNDGAASAADLQFPDDSPRPTDSAVPLESGDVVSAVLSEERWQVMGPVLAQGGSLRAGLYGIAARHGIDPTYPDAVIREADAWSETPGIEDPGLEDLTHLAFVTIDNDDSRDLDQAMHLERTAGGDGFVLRYALADASHYVRPGSALFAEALHRGASYYLPGLSVPMLPRQLCEGVISLNQGVRRRAVVFEMHLDRSARCRRTRLLRARVESVKKLSYRRVQRFYDEPSGSGFAAADFAETLDLLREVGRLRLADARRRHVVDHNRKEVEVRLEPGEHLGFSVLTRHRLEVERYNEQISLMCNVEGARLLERSRGKAWVQAVFRVHPSPSAEQLRHFSEQVRALVRAHGLDSELWSWRRSARAGLAKENLSDYLDRLPQSGRLAGVTRVVERQALLANMQSQYETNPGIHHGVGAEVYARFSAPMREVVGVFTHKEALEALNGPGDARDSVADGVLMEQVVDVGNRARTLQRRITKEANALVLDAIFTSEVELAEGARPVRSALVLGMRSRVIYVELADPPVELKIYLRDLESDRGESLRVDRQGVQLLRHSGHGAAVLRAGDSVQLRLKNWDSEHGRWRFDIVEA